MSDSEKTSAENASIGSKYYIQRYRGKHPRAGHCTGPTVGECYNQKLVECYRVYEKESEARLFLKEHCRDKDGKPKKC